MSRVTRRASAARRNIGRRLGQWLDRLPELPHRGRPRRGSVPTGLKGALVILGAVAILAGANAYLDRSRRTAAAPIEVLLLDTEADPHPLAEAGTRVHYRYIVDGVAYEAVEFRSWSLATVNTAKVCYDPRDPQNRSLTQAEAPCP